MSMMPVPKRLLGRSPLPLVMLTLSLLLAGCSDEREVDPALYAGEGFKGQMARMFNGKEYWQAKVDQLTASVEVKRAAFRDQITSYRKLLESRRQAMRAAQAQAKEKERNDVRKQVMLSFRPQVDAARAKNREANLALRQELRWLEQARGAWMTAGR